MIEDEKLGVIASDLTDGFHESAQYFKNIVSKINSLEGSTRQVAFTYFAMKHLGEVLDQYAMPLSELEFLNRTYLMFVEHAGPEVGISYQTKN
jgi:hypothetical protein